MTFTQLCLGIITLKIILDFMTEMALWVFRPIKKEDRKEPPDP